jgi:hypothetical protein
MSGLLAKDAASEADYAAIELAVMETERGRWFLGEYAKNNRHADTLTLLAALSRIEKSVTSHREPIEIDKFRLDVLEMSKAIARTHAEIAAIKPDDSRGGRLMEASGELDSIVSATETATSEILAAAERVQEAAWTLREAGVEPATCDMLDERATEIYMACSFQDLTSQRIRKVIEALEFLESRVNAMAGIWQFAEETGGATDVAATPVANAALDPSMSQADVDYVLVEKDIDGSGVELDMAHPVRQADPLPVIAAAGVAEIDTIDLAAEAAAGLIMETGPAQNVEIDEMLFSPPEQPMPPPAPTPDHLQLVHSKPEVDSAMQKVRTGGELSADEAAKALDALKSMSIEERTRLFS